MSNSRLDTVSEVISDRIISDSIYGRGSHSLFDVIKDCLSLTPEFKDNEWLPHNGEQTIFNADPIWILRDGKVFSSFGKELTNGDKWQRNNPPPAPADPESKLVKKLRDKKNNCSDKSSSLAFDEAIEIVRLYEKEGNES